MFWRRSTNCCQSKDCCKSTSTSAISSQSESYLDLGRTTDVARDCLKLPRQQSDKVNNLCPPWTYNLFRRDIRPVRKESKHRVEVKIIEKSKSSKIEDHKLIHIVPSKPLESPLNNLAQKAASALSNCISYILPSTSATENGGQTMNIKNTEDDDEVMNSQDSEKPKQRSNEIIQTSSEITHANMVEIYDQHDDEVDASYSPGDYNMDSDEQVQINDLVEKFKAEALNADDALFEKLFERLKNELESCECAGPNPIIDDTSWKFRDDEEEQRDDDIINAEEDIAGVSKLAEICYDIKKDNCCSIQEMRNMFEELKDLLENKLSYNDKRPDEKIGQVLKTSIDIGIIASSENESDKISTQDENPTPKGGEDIEENTVDDEPYNLAEFYDQIMTKMNEIACQCNKEKTGSFNNKDLQINNSLNGHDSHQSSQSLQIQDSKYSGSTNTMQNIDDEGETAEPPRQDETFSEDNEMNPTDIIDRIQLHAEQSERSIPLDQFVTLAKELKEALYTSSCKCSRGKPGTEEEMSPDKIIRGDQISSNITGGAAQDSVEAFVSHPNVDQLSKNTHQRPPLPSVVDSPADSFYSAQCNILQQQNWQMTNSTTDKIDEEVGVNAKCRCVTDQIVQTMENMKLSFGVFCDGQLPAEEQSQQEISDVEIRRKIAKDGDVEKIKVRIRLKGDEFDVDSDQVGEPKSFDNYEIKYETMQNHIDKPKVMKVGNQVKIFIPLDTLATTLETNEKQ